MTRAAAIITAGGSGIRMNAPEPKQFLPLAGEPILLRTARTFLDSRLFDCLVLVVPSSHRDATQQMLALSGMAEALSVVVGGPTRQDSVANGLAAVPDDIDLVAVHDGVRPLASQALIAACLNAAHGSGAAIAALPVTETIKQAGPGQTIQATVDRSALWRAQTPQVARLAWLRKAYAQARQDGFTATDEAALLEHAGFPVLLVPGEEANLKITRPEDLRISEALLMRNHPTAPAMRIGHGFDAHRLVAGRPLVLGGVTIEHEKGLLGHSDADVLTHALCDALLGALGHGDIGRHFPDTDERFRGIVSLRLLEQVAALLAAEGYHLGNADITVVAQRPKLAPHLPAMRAIIAQTCQVAPAAINLKATTTEGMGYAGREEGISCHAVALLWKV